MNELQMERLTNLVTNPYTWLLFAFAISLPYILKYLRRFYPDNVRKKMEKEEACMIENNAKPKVKQLNRIFLLSMFTIPTLFFSVLYLLNYDILHHDGIVIGFDLRTLFILSAYGSVLLVMSLSIIYKDKVAKYFAHDELKGYFSLCGEDSKFKKTFIYNFFDKHGFKILLFIIGMVVLWSAMTLNNYTIFNKNNMIFSKFYEIETKVKQYKEIEKIEFLTQNKCQNIKIYFNDNTIWDLKEYKELKYRGNKKKLVEFVSTKSGIKVKNIVRRN